MLQIRFISNQKHWKFITILNTKDLFLKFGYFGKACMISQWKDEQKTFTRSHILFPHCTKFLLAGSVQDCSNWQAKRIWFEIIKQIAFYSYCLIWLVCHRSHIALCRNLQSLDHSLWRNNSVMKEYQLLNASTSFFHLFAMDFRILSGASGG